MLNIYSLYCCKHFRIYCCKHFRRVARIEGEKLGGKYKGVVVEKRETKGSYLRLANASCIGRRRRQTRPNNATRYLCLFGLAGQTPKRGGEGAMTVGRRNQKTPARTKRQCWLITSTRKSRKQGTARCGNIHVLRGWPTIVQSTKRPRRAYAVLSRSDSISLQGERESGGPGQG